MEHCQFQFTTSYKIVECYCKYIALANFENHPCIVLLISFYTSRHTGNLCFKEIFSIEFNFVNPAYSCTANFKTYCFYFSVIVKSSNKNIWKMGCSLSSYTKTSSPFQLLSQQFHSEFFFQMVIKGVKFVSK